MPANYDKDLRTIVRMIELIREVDGEMPLQMAHTFFCIALKPGSSMQELVTQTGLAQSSISRNVQALSRWHWQRDRETKLPKDGYNLVEAADDPTDSRRKIIYLTPKGRTLASKVISAIRGEKVELEAPTAKEAVRSIFNKAAAAR